MIRKSSPGVQGFGQRSQPVRRNFHSIGDDGLVQRPFSARTDRRPTRRAPAAQSSLASEYPLSLTCGSRACAGTRQGIDPADYRRLQKSAPEHTVMDLRFAGHGS